MSKLGYVRERINSLSEEDLKGATRACLKALACLHSATPYPICACDVRMGNVLWGPEPFLADLEMAHFAPWEVES